jgi:hypothetical protein
MLESENIEHVRYICVYIRSYLNLLNVRVCRSGQGAAEFLMITQHGGADGLSSTLGPSALTATGPARSGAKDTRHPCYIPTFGSNPTTLLKSVQLGEYIIN